MLVILMLISSVGVKFNTEQLVNCRYNTSSEGLKLPTTVGVSPLWLEMNYLLGEETSHLQKDLNSSVSSDSRIARKPTAMDYAIEGFGGIVGGAVGGLSLGFLGYAMVMSAEGETRGLGEIFKVIFGAIVGGIGGYGIGLPVGSSVGVNITGKMIGEDGSFFKTLVGSYIGLGLGTLAAYGLCNVGPEGSISPAIPIGCIMLGSSVGAVIGYNK